MIPDELVKRLEDATEFKLGFPGDFIKDTSAWVMGPANQRTISRGLR